jgi:multicomponent Na+:H+ antiporter subunit B
VSAHVRAWFAVVVAVALAAAVVLAVGDLTPFGTPSGPANPVTRTLAHQRQVANAVNGVTYDLRSLDTLGEELILFVAALGSAVLLRHGRGDEVEADERADTPAARIPDTLRVAGAVLVGPVVVLSVFIITHGHLGPGGGFQGGVLLASGLLLVYTAGQVVALERLEPISLVEVVESAGALAYVLVALGGLVWASAALANFLPLGINGALLSSGTIALLSVSVGVEVTGALALILTEFLDQTLLEGAQ